jgi:hypothetical protein
MLISAWRTRINTKSQKISCSETASLKFRMKSTPQRLNTVDMNCAQNQSTVATMAISPRRLSQPVYHDHPLPPSSFAHQ